MIYTKKQMLCTPYAPSKCKNLRAALYLACLLKPQFFNHLLLESFPLTHCTTEKQMISLNIFYSEITTTMKSDNSVLADISVADNLN
jgi:hypothetical protein